jgi:hypothetical protein
MSKRRAIVAATLFFMSWRTVAATLQYASLCPRLPFFLLDATMCRTTQAGLAMTTNHFSFILLDFICRSICIAIAAEAVSPCRLSLFASITDGVFVHANNNNSFSWAWWCNDTVIQQQYES